MKLIFFILLFLSRAACADSPREASKNIPASESILLPGNTLLENAEDSIPWIFSPALQAGLTFLILGLAILYFISALQTSKLSSNAYLSTFCLAAALLNFPRSETLLPFYFGEGLRIGSELQRQMETVLLLAMLLSLYAFVNINYSLRLSRRLLVGHLVINLSLMLAIALVPLLWIKMAIIVQCLPFLFLFRRRLDLATLSASLLLPLVALYDCCHEYLSLEPNPALVTPYFALVLGLSQLRTLRSLFQLNDVPNDLSPCHAPDTSRPSESPGEMDASDDIEIVLEINKRSLETFTVFMDALHNTLLQMTTRVQKTLSRQDQELKQLYLLAKTIEEGARILGYRLLAEKISRLSSSFVSLIQNLDVVWNPLTIGQEIEAVRKAGRQYLRLNSKIEGRRLEWAAKTSFDRGVKNLKNEDPSLQLPELKRAAEIASKAFEQTASLNLQSTLQTIVLHALRERKTSSEAHLVIEGQVDYPYFLKYDDLSDIRGIVDLIVDNAAKHGFESSYERILRKKTTTSEIKLTLRETDHGIVLSLQDDGRGLAIRRLREWAHEDRLIDLDKGSDLQDYTKLLLLKSWRAPRGLTQAVFLADKIESKIDIVLFPERILNGHCPFAIEVLIPFQRLKAPEGALLQERAG